MVAVGVMVNVDVGVAVGVAVAVGVGVRMTVEVKVGVIGGVDVRVAVGDAKSNLCTGEGGKNIIANPSTPQPNNTSIADRIHSGRRTGDGGRRIADARVAGAG
jgi:hypothetical protein